MLFVLASAQPLEVNLSLASLGNNVSDLITLHLSCNRSFFEQTSKMLSHSLTLTSLRLSSNVSFANCLPCSLGSELNWNLVGDLSEMVKAVISSTSYTKTIEMTLLKALARTKKTSHTYVYSIQKYFLT